MALSVRSRDLEREAFLVDDRMLGDRFELHALEETLDLHLGQARQQHPAVGSAPGRHAGAWLQRRGDQLSGADGRDADQLVVVEHTDRGRLAQRISKPVQQGLHDARQPGGMQVGLSEPQHRRGQREQLVLVPHVAEVGQRDEVAARGGTGQAGRLRDLGDRQARALLVEGLDDLQAFIQPGDQVACQRWSCFIAHGVNPQSFCAGCVPRTCAAL